MKIHKFAFLLVMIIFSVSLIPPAESSGVFLEEGKNILRFNSTDAFYVESFLVMNPEVEVVSFFDGKGTIGYINFLEGIGENFVMQGGIDYEIIMKKNATIIFPF